jgi:Protein of unknown function (DUF4232)
MRAGAVAAIAAGCLIVLMSGCTSGGSHAAVPTARATSAVPRTTGPTGRVTPTRSASAEPAAPRGTVAEFAPCTAAQLTGRPGGTDFFMGTDLHYLVLTNTSKHACTLSGPPAAAAGFRTRGSSQALRIAPDMDSPLAGPVANLRPGGNGYTAIGIGVGRTGITRITFPASRPLWIYTCASPVYVGGYGVPQA